MLPKPTIWRHWKSWGLVPMTKQELNEKTEAVIAETRTALQTVYDTLNKGQQKQVVKNEAVKSLFDRYGVET